MEVDVVFLPWEFLHMDALELKIPPPAVALVIAGLMWIIFLFTPALEVPILVRAVTAASIALVGAGISLAGVISFRRAKTTLNPMKPSRTSSLVNSGIYRLTRNPMYLGLLLVLIAWAVFLSGVWPLLGPVIFVFYINRFQITPEERVLSAMFGADYSAYKSSVSRWL